MKIAYVVRIGHCFYSSATDSTECRIVRSIKNARFFNDKKDAFLTAHRYGGRAFELKLSNIEKERESK